jgi:hypothetical protein
MMTNILAFFAVGSGVFEVIRCRQGYGYACHHQVVQVLFTNTCTCMNSDSEVIVRVSQSVEAVNQTAFFLVGGMELA